MGWYKEINVEAKVQEHEQEIARLTDQINTENYADHMRQIGAHQLKIKSLQQSRKDFPAELSIPKTSVK